MIGVFGLGVQELLILLVGLTCGLAAVVAVIVLVVALSRDKEKYRDE
ncbi:MAG TPA: hypothetical protein VNK04_16335 [Gemmataceae bacterium]|jgi:hypothetical protein|nr:hypothetical protein [Gemmataceae bacterium]